MYAINLKAKDTLGVRKIMKSGQLVQNLLCVGSVFVLIATPAQGEKIQQKNVHTTI